MCIRDRPVRRWALFGFHGSFVNITDGRYLYMRAAANVGNSPLYEYTLMPTHQQLSLIHISAEPSPR